MPLSLLVKNRLSQKEIETFPHLLKNYSEILISSGILSFSEYVKYFINSIDYFLHKNKKSYLLVIENKKNILGIALLRFMEWDSNFFKMPIGCIEYILVDDSLKGKDGIGRELLREGTNLAKRIGMRILYISTNSERYFLINILNSLRFNFICSEMQGIIRKKDMSYIYAEEKLDTKYKFRKYKKEDFFQVIKIAQEITGGLNSKFSLNPYLPQEEKRNYYLENIKNCCLGLNANNIFVLVKNDTVVGFVCYRDDRTFKETLRNKVSFLVMAGVPKSERRKGLGRYLFNRAHKQIFRDSDLILWKAYLHNLPMIKSIFSRKFIPSFEFIYTFCKKL